MPLQLSNRVRALGAQAQSALTEQFARIDAIAEQNAEKVLAAFQKHKVAEVHFQGTTGYGYDDLGREVLGEIYADIFGTEDAMVRINFVNGTHAIASALYGVLRPGDTLVSAIGAPYDTLQGVIGITGDGNGSLREFGVHYQQVYLTELDEPDLKGIAQAVQEPAVKAVLIQRSRGYATRASLSVEKIGEIIGIIRQHNPTVYILVDNCYGEFVETIEPSQVGADLIMGSLIKNPGGGLAPMGGYVAGRHDLVDSTAMRMTVPGIGPTKTAVFAAKVMELLGYRTDPLSSDLRHDIIQMIHLEKPESVEKFCRGIQLGAPVDSYVTPVPWDMPGYDCPVIMAAGAFIQGASIELSADAPMRPPYTVYMQGGLTYESGKLGILLAAEELLK